MCSGHLFDGGTSLIQTKLLRLQEADSAKNLRNVEKAVIEAVNAHTDASAEDQATLLETLQAIDQLHLDQEGSGRLAHDEKLQSSYATMAKASAQKFWGSFYQRLIDYRASLWDQEAHGPLAQAAT